MEVQSQVRRYLLLTLSRAEKTQERQMLDKQETVERIRKAMECTTLLVPREKHGEHGHHFHRFYIRLVSHTFY